MNKKIKLFSAVLFTTLGFISCSEDDDTNYEIPNYLVGKWELSQVGSLNAQGGLSYEDVEIEENCQADNFQFEADYSYSENDYQEGCILETTSGTYEIANGNIITSAPGQGQDPETEITYDILALTNVDLEVVYTNPTSNQLTFLKFKRS